MVYYYGKVFILFPIFGFTFFKFANFNWTKVQLKKLPNHFVCKPINGPRTYKLFVENWLQPSCASKKVITRQKLLVRNVTQKYEENKSKKYPWPNQHSFHLNKLGLMISFSEASQKFNPTLVLLGMVKIL
jgi:hypothetical protein